MKIMLVLQSLVGGGAERVAVVLAGALAGKGHEVLLVSDKTRLDEPFVYDVDARVRMIRYFGDKVCTHRMYKYFPKRMRHYLNLRRIVLNERPDVMVAFMNVTFLKTLLASIGTKTGIVASEHNAFERPPCAPMTRRDYFFKFFVNKLFDTVTVLTEADKSVIGNRLKHVYVMPNPLAFQPIPLHELSKKRKKQIVAAGRMDAWHCKGFDLLIRAWGRIAKHCNGWTLNIAGQGDEMSFDHLKGIVQECHVESSVVFSGFHKDVNTLFRESEIFVLSSRYEGFGNVLLEAMSQGCACIACDYKGRQREIIRNETEGLCIEPEDVEQLAKAILRMITDEVYRNSVRINGISCSKDHDVSIIADRWLNMFEEIRQRKKTRRNAL